MTFLPIVQRELRLRSRKWTTYWLRAGVGMFAALLTMAFMLIAWIAQTLGAGAGSAKIGQALFLTLAWLTFVFCLLEGARSTADCLSEEKREGTLGLLFLTDLRGYDVVLGKFVAASLNSFYGLLAVFPVLGASLLIGGVAPAQFWRMILVLANTLFFTTTAGLLVSALCRRQSRAWAGTLGLIFGIAIIPVALTLFLPMVSSLSRWASLAPLSDLLSNVSVQAFVEMVGRISPAMGFWEALASGYGRMPASFWSTVWGTHLTSWLMLALASLCLPHAWQESNRGADRRRTWFSQRAPDPARLQAQAERRAKFLDANPVVWLATRDDPHKLLPWLLVIAAVAGTACLSLFGTTALGFAGLWLTPFELAFEIWVALRACRFFAEARASGALELFLTTPLTERAIIGGQLLALKERFLVPLIVFVVAETGIHVFIALANPNPSGIYIAGAIQSLSLLWQLAGFVARLFAVIYTGMWLALVLKKPNHAFGLTILGLFVLPVIVPCFGDIGVYVFFIFFPKYKLETDLRRLIAGDPAPRQVTLPPPRPVQPPPLPALPGKM